MPMDNTVSCRRLRQFTTKIVDIVSRSQFDLGPKPDIGNLATMEYPEVDNIFTECSGLRDIFIEWPPYLSCSSPSKRRTL